jgi:heme-degrading monooxygenase HmoA
MAGNGFPVRAALTMTVPLAVGSEFERRWARVATWAQGQPGCLRQSLTRTSEAGTATYVITSDWADRTTFQRFETSSRQDEATKGLRALRTSVHMEVLEIVDHRENT